MTAARLFRQNLHPARRGRLNSGKSPVSTHVRQPDGSVPLHNRLHLVERAVVVAAELEPQRPIGGQRRQPYELERSAESQERRRPPRRGSARRSCPPLPRSGLSAGAMERVSHQRRSRSGFLRPAHPQTPNVSDAAKNVAASGHVILCYVTSSGIILH